MAVEGNALPGMLWAALHGITDTACPWGLPFMIRRVSTAFHSLRSDVATWSMYNVRSCKRKWNGTVGERWWKMVKDGERWWRMVKVEQESRKQRWLLVISNRFEGVSLLFFVILHGSIQGSEATDRERWQGGHTSPDIAFSCICTTLDSALSHYCSSLWIINSPADAHSYRTSLCFTADHALQGAAKSTAFSRFQSSCRRFAGLLVTRLQSVPEPFVVACSGSLQ